MLCGSIWPQCTYRVRAHPEADPEPSASAAVEGRSTSSSSGNLVAVASAAQDLKLFRDFRLCPESMDVMDVLRLLIGVASSSNTMLSNIGTSADSAYQTFAVKVR